MYLSMLNNEQKHLFLDLELYMSKVDGDFSEEEKNIINAHCMEMRIDNNNYESEVAVDELFTAIKEKFTHKEKHILFLELTATVLADGVYDEAEKELIDKLAEILDITKNEVQEVFKLITDLKDVYSRCAAFIQEG